MNVLLKLEVPDGYILPKIDEISLGDDKRDIKIVEIIPEPYYLNYTKGETQVHEGAVLQITDDSEEPLKVVQIKKELPNVEAVNYAIDNVTKSMAKDTLNIRPEQRGVPTEQVNHPDHYNKYSVEVMSMMVRIWGEAKAKIFCELNAFKYRMRAGLKGTAMNVQTGLVDLQKEKWYLDYAKGLKDGDDTESK